MHSKVHEAARSGDFDSLETIILGNGEDLFHETTPKKNNILHVAAQYNQVNLIDRLLQCQSGPSLLWQGNSKGDTPLHVAAKAGSYEAVRAFTIFAKLLHWVVENGQVDACRELLQKPNLHGDTALHYAIRGRHDEVATLLIEENPQLCDLTNAAAESPLYLAVDQKLPNTYALILDASPLSSSHKGPKGLTALHTAIECKMPGWWKILENRPEVIKEGDDLGWTPLHYLASRKNTDVEAVRRLLQHDTSVAYVEDKEGQSALHIAAFSGHVSVIDEIVRSCPDAWDIISVKGQTALHTAVIGGQADVVKYILGMPYLEDLINEQDSGGNTALHLAVLHEQYEIICILTGDKRVNRIAKNKDHLTALDIFYTHEFSSAVARVGYMLKGSSGMPSSQDSVIKYVKKRLNKQHVEGQHAESQHADSTTTESNPASRENDNSLKKGFVDLQLLVATLIATVTFAATFTMPGVYNNSEPNQGMATLADSSLFRCFVMYNSVAFYLSILAIDLLFLPSLSRRHVPAYRHSCTKMAGGCIFTAIIFMGVAFACGTLAVLPRVSRSGILIPSVVVWLFNVLWLGFVASWRESDSVIKNYSWKAAN